MTFLGFFARRVVRSVVNGIIDEIADDKEEAKEMKEGARWLITGVGVTASLLAADPVGFIDAVTDHGTHAAIDHGVDLITDHGIDAVTEHASSIGDHVASTSDVHFGGSHLLAATVGAAPSLSDWLTNLSWSEKGQVLEYYLSHFGSGTAERISQLPLHDALQEAEKLASTALKTAARLKFGGNGPYSG